MKATLEFNLPEEAMKHRHALNGPRYLSILDEVDGMARIALADGDLTDPKVVTDVLEAIRKLMPEEL
jgi:hypothetical protein